MHFGFNQTHLHYILHYIYFMLNSLGMPFYQSKIRKRTFTFFSGKDMLQAENITESSHT